MKHYATPPGFDPSVMIDVDALRKELVDDADVEEELDEGMMLEEEDQN
jgi:hypothetical protein